MANKSNAVDINVECLDVLAQYTHSAKCEIDSIVTDSIAKRTAYFKDEENISGGAMVESLVSSMDTINDISEKIRKCFNQMDVICKRIAEMYDNQFDYSGAKLEETRQNLLNAKVKLQQAGK